MIKNLSILILKDFFLSLAFLWEAKQSISCNICFFLTIIYLEMILREFLGSTNLTKTQVFHIYKSAKVIIISKDKNFVFTVLQILALSLKNLNNG